MPEMQTNHRSIWQGVSLAFMAALLIAGIALSVPVGVSAQGPTPTPNDPVWRAFSTVRDAIEEKKRVDLTIVQRWEFAQSEFEPGGIDNCVDLDDPNQGRPIYFGWTITITSLRGDVYQGRSSFDLTVVAVCDRVITAAAPAPAPDNPDLPAPVAGSGAAGGFELGGHVLELSNNTKALMNRAGMTWVKKQLRWNVGDGTGTAANMINQARAQGLRVLLGVVGQPSQMGNFEDYIQQYANFVGEVAALGPDAIEVWNEPNIDREWPTGQVNGANYTRLLAAAFNSIKSRNPNVIVISGAPAPSGFWGTAGCGPDGCNDDVFMQQMAAAGAANYMDCVGLHYNEGIVAPNVNSGDPRGEYPTYYFNSMLQRGYGPFGGKPVCFTELGYLSGEDLGRPIPGGFAWAGNTTVAQHANWLAQAVSQAAQSGRVRLLIVWNVDFPDMGGADPMGGYAMLRRDGTCPACDQLGTVMGVR
jgi:hypothetical protein